MSTKPLASQVRYVEPLGAETSVQAKLNTLSLQSDKAILSFPDITVATAAATKLPNGQQVDVTSEQKRYRVEAGVLVFVASLDQLRIDLGLESGAEKIGVGYDFESLAEFVSASIDRSPISVRELLTPSERIDVAAGTISINLLPKLQAIVNMGAATGAPVFINKGTYGIDFLANGDGLIVPSGSDIRFHPKALIKARATNKNNYSVIKLDAVDDVNLYSPRCDGNNAQNTATSGEWGMGIRLLGGSNINIYDPVTNNCWGDGMYVGVGAGNTTPTNVMVYNHRARACRRQGMSMIRGKSVHFYSPEWVDIGGTFPQAGFDIEANTKDDILEDILIDNPVTRNCVGVGCLVSIGAMFHENGKTIDVKIRDHTDYGSSSAAVFHCRKTASAAGALPMSGTVEYRNAFSKDSKYGAFGITDWSASGPRLIIESPNGVDWNRSGGTSAALHGGIAIYQQAVVFDDDMGNVDVIHPSLEYTSGSTPSMIFVGNPTNASYSTKSVRIIDPISLKGGATRRLQLGGKLESFFWSDKFSQLPVRVAASYPISRGTNQITEMAAGIPLTGTLGVSGELTSDIGDILVVAGGGANQQVRGVAGCFAGEAGTVTTLLTTQKGAYLRLRPLGLDKYMIIERIGGWVAS